MTRAAGSFGQFAMLPTTFALLSGLGWPTTLLLLAATLAVVLPLGATMRAPTTVGSAPGFFLQL